MEPVDYGGRDSGVCRVHRRTVDKSPAPASTHSRRDATVVFAVHDGGSADCIYQMEIPVDSVILTDSGGSVHLHQYPQSRDTRPKSDAGTAECMVCAPRHGVYILLQCLRLCLPLGSGGTVAA